jgi:hypothetical protein
MDSISNARNFFINQQGLSSEEADTLISKGLESYNQQRQPQTMMQMASGGRAGYQMGGLSTMSMDTGSPLKVPPQQQSMFTSTGSPTSSPLLNYGQTNIGQAGGTPLTRNGYQEGGLTDFYNNKEPIIPRIENIGGLLDQAEQSIGEPKNNFTSPLATTFSGFGMRDGGIARLGYQMGGEAGMPQMGGGEGQPQMDPQQALTVILQMLLEKGVPMEEAQKLAIKIIELFTQGGEQAVEEFANQLEQQEAQQMASGGIAGLYPRQGYFIGGALKAVGKAVGSVAKGIGNAVKSIVKSPIGKIALTIAAVTFGGPMLAAGLGISGAAGAALAGGLANSALQLASGQKFNPLEALISAGGAYAGAGGFSGSDVANAGTNIGAQAAEANVANYVSANPVSSVATAEQLTNPAYFSPTEYAGPASSITAGPAMNVSNGLTGQVGTGYATPQPNQPFQLQGVGNTSPIDMGPVYNDYSYPSAIDKFKTSVGNFGTDMSNNVRSGIENLSTDPLGTISNYASRAYNTAKENALPIGTGLLLASSLGGAPEEDTTDEDEKRRQEEVQALLNYYGRNLNVTNPNFYTTYGAKNPFETAAQGGIMGYKKGGSMVPPARQIEGGVIELDARKTGGYIPYGKKERVDDVPAMLAKDEFVFTSRAVKAAGGGSAQRGAAKMYALMKQLEGART